MTQGVDGFDTDIGSRGLVIYGRRPATPTEFEYVKEDTWRSLPSFPLQDQTEPVRSLSMLNVALATLGDSVFVDLDQLNALSLGPKAQAVQNTAATNSGPIMLPPGRNIVLKEFNKLYVVPQAAWSTAEVEISGDAGVLINRDAVLAPIPSNPIAEGTFCLLVNLAALR